MIESLGALGGYGITSVIVIIVAFFLFARFVKKSSAISLWAVFSSGC